MAAISKPSWTSTEAQIGLDRAGVLRCEGAWTIPHLADLDHRLAAVQWPRAAEMACDASAITAMDTGGAVLLQRLAVQLRQQGGRFVIEGLRPEFADILRIVSSNWDQSRIPAETPGSWSV